MEREEVGGYDTVWKCENVMKERLRIERRNRVSKKKKLSVFRE